MAERDAKPSTESADFPDAQVIPSVLLTRQGVLLDRVAAVQSKDLAAVVPPAAIAVALGELGEEALEALAGAFFVWVFDRMFGSSQNLRSLLEQFCQYICSFVYRTVEEARIKTKLQIAAEKLDLIRNQLVQAAHSDHPDDYYKPLLTDGIFGSVFAAYRGLSEEAGEVAIVNYSIAATLELKVIAERVSRKLERSHAFTARVKDHQQYVKSSADNLRKATGNGIKVGACREFEPFDAPNFQTPFNTPATKPGEPGAPEDRNWDHVGAWPQAFVRFWLQRPDPFSPSGIHFLMNEVKHLWACFPRDTGGTAAAPGQPGCALPPAGPDHIIPKGEITKQVVAHLAIYRGKEAELSTQMLSALESSALKPVEELIAVWPKLTEAGVRQ